MNVASQISVEKWHRAHWNLWRTKTGHPGVTKKITLWFFRSSTLVSGCFKFWAIIDHEPSQGFPNVAQVPTPMLCNKKRNNKKPSECHLKLVSSSLTSLYFWQWFLWFFSLNFQVVQYFQRKNMAKTSMDWYSLSPSPSARGGWSSHPLILTT